MKAHIQEEKIFYFHCILPASLHNNKLNVFFFFTNSDTFIDDDGDEDDDDLDDNAIEDGSGDDEIEARTHVHVTQSTTTYKDVVERFCKCK